MLLRYITYLRYLIITFFYNKDNASFYFVKSIYNKIGIIAARFGANLFKVALLCCSLVFIIEIFYCINIGPTFVDPYLYPLNLYPTPQIVSINCGLELSCSIFSLIFLICTVTVEISPIDSSPHTSLNKSSFEYTLFGCFARK